MLYSLSRTASLTIERIDQMVPKVSPGIYVLERAESLGQFQVNYVGRSDNSLNARLKTHVGSEYRYFKFDYASSPKDAFEKQCEIYHDFGGPEFLLDNKSHPDRQSGSGWKCPRCKIFS